MLRDVVVKSLRVYSVTRLLKSNDRMHEKPKYTLGADRCFKMECRGSVEAREAEPTPDASVSGLNSTADRETVGGGRE